jgi:hypothetical protein
MRRLFHTDSSAPASRRRAAFPASLYASPFPLLRWAASDELTLSSHMEHSNPSEEAHLAHCSIFIFITVLL